MKEIKIRVPTPDDVIPEEFKHHMMQAYKEILLAFKSLIDDRIKKIESKENKKIKKIEIS
uniref:Uncharacterized protein n=1 Tax=Geoglobus ahangari TaxID=113653 RepID=A0A7C4S8Q9_9EURY